MFGKPSRSITLQSGDVVAVYSVVVFPAAGDVYVCCRTYTSGRKFWYVVTDGSTKGDLVRYSEKSNSEVDVYPLLIPILVRQIERMSNYVVEEREEVKRLYNSLEHAAVELYQYHPEKSTHDYAVNYVNDYC